MAVQNMSLDRFRGASGVGNILWLFFVLQNILYYMYPTPHVTFSEVFISTVIYLARNTIIAAKSEDDRDGPCHARAGRNGASEWGSMLTRRG